jgi:hypothetical protein
MSLASASASIVRSPFTFTRISLRSWRRASSPSNARSPHGRPQRAFHASLDGELDTVDPAHAIGVHKSGGDVRTSPERALPREQRRGHGQVVLKAVVERDRERAVGNGSPLLVVPLHLFHAHAVAVRFQAPNELRQTYRGRDACGVVADPAPWGSVTP